MDEFLFYYKKVVLKNYSNFNGRARRKEFWMFVLVNVIIAMVVGFVGSFFGNTASSVLSGLYSVAVLVPGIAVSVRRLHDIGKSGWLILLALIPVIGAIILLIWDCKEGQQFENEYGANPKEIMEVENETIN